MSKITTQCRLISSASNRQQLWKLMAELNTPLINELLQQLNQHPDFEKWRQKGKLPSTVVYKLCQPLKTDPRFAGQPSRFYMSVIHVADYIYKSWLAVQKRLQQKLDGKTCWLEMLQSNAELVAYTLIFNTTSLVKEPWVEDVKPDCSQIKTNYFSYCSTSNVIRPSM